MGNWNDFIVGDRMTVDQEFSEQVQNSQFTSQEWGLIMTATDFEIENPQTDEARIVADTENLPEIMPELKNIRNQMPGGPGGQGQRGGGSGGFLSGVKDALGLGGSSGGVDQKRLEAARELTQRYATELQRHLEERGKWERVQEIAARDDEETSD